jgi:hypothetical protein
MTRRDSAKKESWNGLRDCGWRGELGAPPRGAGSLHRAGCEHGGAVRRDRTRGRQAIYALCCRLLRRLAGLEILLDPRSHFSTFGNGPED